MASSIGPGSPVSIRPGLAHYLQVAKQDGAPGFADRFEADLQKFPGDNLDEVRSSASAAATSEAAAAHKARRKGWLEGVAGAATWLVLPFVGTLAAAPIFYAAHNQLKAGKAHREAAEEAGWFLSHLPPGAH